MLLRENHYYYCTYLLSRAARIPPPHVQLQFRDDKRCVEDLMAEAKFVVSPETKQLEFEAALLAHEDEICAEYERKQAEAAAAKESGGGKGDDAANGKDDGDSRSNDGDRDRRGRSRSGGRDRRGRSSRSRSRSCSRSRSRGRGSSRKEKKAEKEKEVPPPKRGFQEILDKRAVNLGIVFDALVEKAVVKRKEEVRAPGLADVLLWCGFGHFLTYYHAVLA